MHPVLTPKQQKFLDYLESEINKTGKSPSLRQAAARMGVSHAAISQLIKALEKKGIIKRDGYYSRTIHLLNRARETAGVMRWTEVPIVGNIAAGLPLYAQQEWAGSVVVDAAVYRGLNLFALKVKGDSMINPLFWMETLSFVSRASMRKMVKSSLHLFIRKKQRSSAFFAGKGTSNYALKTWLTNP